MLIRLYFPRTRVLLCQGCRSHTRNRRVWGVADTFPSASSLGPAPLRTDQWPRARLRKERIRHDVIIGDDADGPASLLP